MRKTAIIVLLVLVFGAGLLYAAGNLIVTGRLGVGGVTNPGCSVDVAGDVNVTGSYKINGGAVGLPAVLAGPVCGLRITNDTTSPNTGIDVSANMIGTVAPSGTIVIDCTHSGLPTGNDLDTGSLRVSSWYYIWAIYNGTSPAGLASLSRTSPAVPTGYTYKSLIGVAVTDGSAHFKVFAQQGNHFVYDEYQLVNSDTAAQSWTTQNCASYIPPISTRGYFQVELWSANACVGALKKNGSPSTVGHIMGQVSPSSGLSVCNDWIDTDGSQIVQYYTSANVSQDWYLRIVGFELNL